MKKFGLTLIAVTMLLQFAPTNAWSISKVLMQMHNLKFNYGPLIERYDGKKMWIVISDENMLKFKNTISPEIAKPTIAIYVFYEKDNEVRARVIPKNILQNGNNGKTDEVYFLDHSGEQKIGNVPKSYLLNEYPSKGIDEEYNFSKDKPYSLSFWNDKDEIILIYLNNNSLTKLIQFCKSLGYDTSKIEKW